MGFLLLILFIGLPIAEIALLIEVGGAIGLAPTLAIIFGTAIAGTWMIRQQGFSTLRRAQAHLDRGELPVQEAFDGVSLLIAGAFLLTPGFLTDGFGFLLLVPPIRLVLRKFIVGYLLARGTIQVSGQADGFGPPPGAEGDVINGEFEDITRPADRPSRNAIGSEKTGGRSDAGPVVPPKE